jgi:F0F1-type ATP synthase membrane subunit b/b'
MLTLAVPAGVDSVTAADQGDLKRSMKKVGEGMKEFGKKVGEAGKEAGQEIADASKKVWYKGKQVSAKLLSQVQTSTRKWWKDVIEEKDDALDDLREENRKLKRELAEKEGG